MDEKGTRPNIFITRAGQGALDINVFLFHEEFRALAYTHARRAKLLRAAPRVLFFIVETLKRQVSW